MAIEIQLPKQVPVMTLPDTVFFPQVMLPLHVFESRYKRMLEEVLHSHRIFVVASIDPSREKNSGAFEPACRVATAGIIRACQVNADGTSNLILQGLCRVEFLRSISENPFRLMEINPLFSVAGGNRAQLLLLRRQLLGCIRIKRKLGLSVPGEMLAFLKEIEEPETIADMAAFSLCEDAHTKQILLETLNTCKRMQLLIDQTKQEIEAVRLQRKLQGNLDDDDICNN